MKILMLYARDQYTTARHFENAIRRTKEFQFLGVGFTKQGLASVQGDNAWIPSGQEIVITDLLTKLPARPDVIIAMQGFTHMKVYGLESIDIPTVYYGIDTHMVKDMIFDEAKNYKHVFFAQKKAIPEFKEFCGKESHWLPCCAEPIIHKPMDFKEEYDFAFVGGVDMSEAHKSRRDAIMKLKEKYKVFVGNAYGYFMTMQYNKAKVVFNYAVNDDLNMRVFEAMACKRPLLTNKLSLQSGLSDLFKDGEHYIGFDDKDLMEKAEMLIKDKALRDKIALSGYNETIKNHTYTKRLEDLWKEVRTSKQQ